MTDSPNLAEKIEQEFFQRMFGYWDGHSEQLRGFIKLIILRAQPSGDWVWVPREPTPKMVKAGADTGCFVCSDEDANEYRWQRNAATVYRAMVLSAAKERGLE